MFVPVQNLAWLIYPFYCFIRIFRSFVLCFKRTFEEMCFTVQLSMFFAVSATAFVFYHVVFALSRTFLTFLKKFFRSQLASSNSDTLSCRFEFVKNFFHLFLTFFSSPSGWCSRCPLRHNSDRIPLVFSFVNTQFCCFQKTFLWFCHCLTSCPTQLGYNNIPVFICQQFLRFFYLFRFLCILWLFWGIPLVIFTIWYAYL